MSLKYPGPIKPYKGQIVPPFDIYYGDIISHVKNIYTKYSIEGNLTPQLSLNSLFIWAIPTLAIQKYGEVVQANSEKDLLWIRIYEVYPFFGQRYTVMLKAESFDYMGKIDTLNLTNTTTEVAFKTILRKFCKDYHSSFEIMNTIGNYSA